MSLERSRPTRSVPVPPHPEAARPGPNLNGARARAPRRPGPGAPPEPVARPGTDSRSPAEDGSVRAASPREQPRPTGAGGQSAAGGLFPPPAALARAEPFVWDDGRPDVENYAALGRRLAATGDLYRTPEHGGGLLHVPDAPGAAAVPVRTARQLAPLVVDRVRVQVVRGGKTWGGRIPAAHLNTMLASEAFLQAFTPVDDVVRLPRCLPTFQFTAPGFNDAGPGRRVLHRGPAAAVRHSVATVRKFLGVMAFASPADRTNALAAALTVRLRHLWPGARPLLLVTSTKSHAGKDTVIQFAAGRTPLVAVDYQGTDWAFRQGLVAALRARPEAGVVSVANARLGRGERHIASATLERFLTDPEPVLHSSKERDALKLKNNHLVLALSTNHGTVSEDLMNRALPVHLAPVGNVADRVSPIGNPRLEFLPANGARVEAELHGMVARWVAAGQPLDQAARHPFTDWARTVGGILRCSGFEGFLANYGARRTADDPVRRALGLLGRERPGEWLRPGEWAAVAADLSVLGALIPREGGRTDRGRERELGVVLSAHEGETFAVPAEGGELALALERRRGRFEAGREPSARYRFVVPTRGVTRA